MRSNVETSTFLTLSDVSHIVSDIEVPMSDGPHRSLPMRPAWRRVAHWADRQAFAPEEVSEALSLAVEQDCRQELRPEFLADLRRVVEEPSLFHDGTNSRLDALKPNAGAGLERAVIDRLCFLTESEVAGLATLQAAVAMAAQDCANRRARQIEEHLLRRTSSSRARNACVRLQAAKDATNFTSLAARLFGIAPNPRAAAPAIHTGLDDGVRLR